MGSIGPWQIIIVVLLVVLLFGRGKISDMMGDVAKGIKSFKKGITDDDADADPKPIESASADPVETTPKDNAAKE